MFAIPDLVDFVGEGHSDGQLFSGGVVLVWILKKLGSALPKFDLQQGLTQLQEALRNATSNGDEDDKADPRVHHPRNAIRMLRGTLRMSSWLVVAIFQVSIVKKDGSPWHQPARRLEDGTLVPLDDAEDAGQDGAKGAVSKSGTDEYKYRTGW